MWFKAMEVQKKKRSLSPPWLRELCPSSFLPMLQSPKSPPHPNTTSISKFPTPQSSFTPTPPSCPLSSQHLLQTPSKWRAQEIWGRSREENRESPYAGQALGCTKDPCALPAAISSHSHICCDTEKDSLLQTSRPDASSLPIEGSLGDENFLQGEEAS